MPFRLRDHLPFSAFGGSSFIFHDPGPLVDDDLELVEPSYPYIDSVLRACRHPQTLNESPALADTSRQQLRGFVDACPHGHQIADAATGAVASYHFWMRTEHNPELTIAGGIGLRIGRTYDLEMYTGHIGYHVYPPARGHHFAERACRLLLPLAERHGLDPLWITCNPDNYPSRRTCERLGGRLVEIVPVPVEHPLFQRGETEKCRFRFDLH
jgi:tagatose 1,6-diphosphate aldolase